MNKTLILNFGQSNEILLSSHFISSYRTEFPNTEISLLCFEEEKVKAQTLSHINNIFTINRTQIQTITNNQLYSNAFAVNSFFDGITDVIDTNWDNIINYSNDNVSAFLLKAFTSKKITGAYVAQNGTAKTTNKWATYQNHVMPKIQRQTLHPVTVRNHMVNSPYYAQVDKFKVDQNYAMVANQNFHKIRDTKPEKETMIMGISLEAGYDGHCLDFTSLCDIIETIEDSRNYKTVLLLNGKNYQKEMASKLNEKFNNSLISINVDPTALTAVMSNIDVILSSTNDHLITADAMETRCIEVRNIKDINNSPVVMNEENYIILQNEDTNIASDVLLALNEVYETELPIDQMATSNKTYKTFQDDYGLLYTQIRGELDIQNELRYHIQRCLHFQMMGYPKNDELLDHIRDNTESEYLTEFVTNLKSELTSTVKILLASLRSLKGVKNSQSNLDNFINYLDTLMSSGKEDTLIGSVVRFFEGNVENIEAEDINANMKMIETELFNLKNNLQVLTNIADHITNIGRENTQSSNKDSSATLEA